MAKYKVKHTNIMHNNDLYKEGSIIELTEAEAKRLADFVDFVSESKKAESTNKQTNSKTNKTSAKAQTETKSETKGTETSTSVGEGSDGGDADGK